MKAKRRARDLRMAVGFFVNWTLLHPSEGDLRWKAIAHYGSHGSSVNGSSGEVSSST
jgi:hypothetical protein